jgi:hypothetical protein
VNLTEVLRVTCERCNASFRGPRGDAMADWLSEHLHGKAAGHFRAVVVDVDKLVQVVEQKQ